MRERPNHTVAGLIFVGVCIALAVVIYLMVQAPTDPNNVAFDNSMITDMNTPGEVVTTSSNQPPPDTQVSNSAQPAAPQDDASGNTSSGQTEATSPRGTATTDAFADGEQRKPVPQRVEYIGSCMAAAERDQGGFGSTIERAVANATCECVHAHFPPHEMTQDQFVGAHDQCTREQAADKLGFVARYYQGGDR